MNEDEDDLEEGEVFLDEDDEQDSDEGARCLPLSYERVMCSEELNRIFEASVVTKEQQELARTYKYIVFHNVEYGCTGDMAVFGFADVARQIVGRHLHLYSLVKTIRGHGGCASTEVNQFRSLQANKELANLFLHLAALHIMPDPGPKIILGISAQSYDSDPKNWKALCATASPHDGWSSLERIRVMSLTYNNLNGIEKPAPYIYVPCVWDWDARHNDWQVWQYMEHAKISYTKYLSESDVSHIPYLKHTVNKAAHKEYFKNET